MSEQRYMIQIIPLPPRGESRTLREDAAEAMRDRKWEFMATTCSTSVGPGEDLSDDALVRMTRHGLLRGLEWLTEQTTEKNVRRLIFGPTEEDLAEDEKHRETALRRNAALAEQEAQGDA